MFFVFVLYLSVYSHVFKPVSLKDAWNIASLTPWRPTSVTPVLRIKTAGCWRPHVTLQSQQGSASDPVTSWIDWPIRCTVRLASQMHCGTGQSDAPWDWPVRCTVGLASRCTSGLASQMHHGTGVGLWDWPVRCTMWLASATSQSDFTKHCEVSSVKERPWWSCTLQNLFTLC